MHKTVSLVLIMVASLALACDKKAGEGGESGEGGSAEPPAKPANGSPVAVKFVGFEDGERRRVMKVSLYNFGPKTAAGYVLLARYTDKDGEVLKVKPGTPFEKDHDFTSLSGGRFKVAPNKWTPMTIEMLEIPEGAVAAEVLVSKVEAVADDGAKIEDWWSQDNWSEWPAGQGDKNADDGAGQDEGGW